MTDGRRAGPLFIEAGLQYVFGANAGPVGQPCLEPECELGCRGPHSWGEGFPRVEGKVEHIWAGGSPSEAGRQGEGAGTPSSNG